MSAGTMVRASLAHAAHASAAAHECACHCYTRSRLRILCTIVHLAATQAAAKSGELQKMLAK